MTAMAKTVPLTISALRESLARFKDDDSIEKVWQDQEGQKVLKQVSLLVRREESRSGQASLSPRIRALRAITVAGEIDPPSNEDMLSWSSDHASFWTIRLDFGGRQEVDMIHEALGNRLQMISHLDSFNRSLRVRKRFLCLFFYDFAKMVHPNAERLGAATMRSVVAQLQFCGMEHVDTVQLRAFIAIGRRLDELVRLAGAGAVFCLPKEADDSTRLEHLGELIPDLAQWLLDAGLEQWSQSHGADSLGIDARKLMVESVVSPSSSNAELEHCASVSSLDFMFVQ